MANRRQFMRTLSGAAALSITTDVSRLGRMHFLRMASAMPDTDIRSFLRFLRRLDNEFPGEAPLHLIMDNYGTHKHAQVKAWLKRNPRFVSHFVPTGSSWMNLVERSAAASSVV